MTLHANAIIAVTVALNLTAWLIDIPRLTFPGLETPIRWGLYATIPFVLVFHLKPSAYAQSPVAWTFGLFLIVNVFSAATQFAESPGSVAFALRMTLAFLLLLLVCYSPTASRASLNTVILVCAIVSITSLFTLPFLSDSVIQNRFRGLTPHPNVLGLSSALAIAGLIGRARFSSVIGIIHISILALLCWIALLTKSEIASITVIALLVANTFRLLLGAIGAPNASKKVPGQLAWLGAAACIMPPVLTFVLPAQVIINFSGNDLANIERVYAWKLSANTFSMHPIFGEGVSNSIQVVSEGYQRASNLLYSHSVALHHLRTTGLVGTFMLTLALVLALRLIIRASAKTTKGVEAAYMIFAVLMFSAVEAGLQGSQASWIVLYVLCGTALTGVQPILKEGTLLRRTTASANRLAPQEPCTTR